MVDLSSGMHVHCTLFHGSREWLVVDTTVYIPLMSSFPEKRLFQQVDPKMATSITSLPNWNMEMSMEEYIQWMKEETEKYKRGTKEIEEERDRKHKEYMERSHQEHLK